MLVRTPMRRANTVPRVGGKIVHVNKKLFLVLFKYFIVIIKKVEMLYVVRNIIAG